jgi:diaminohydroxyphosphoribosylaminopyrimidine deaminase/5-amino-6-(5-phosphoribosylamino)uracil reductase
MSDTKLMQRALQLARRGRGAVEPNPMVGAVLARDGVILAQGYHRKFGQRHAEIDALRDAREDDIDPSGCDLYVTLEPCCHHGKTPPCAEAIIDANIARVFVAMEDLNPQVAGQGIAQLRAAGIEVHVGLCEAEATQLNEPYIKRTTIGLPWVIVKWAQTLDGKTATAGGDSQWISNEQSRRIVHQLRGRVDAIIVGINTALHDNPILTARDVRPRRIARRVVIDPRARLPRDANVFNDDAPLTVAVNDPSAADLPGAEIVSLPLENVLRHLADAHGATNVLVEGGATLVGSLIEAKLVDELIVFTAPKLLGDDRALGAVRGLACERIADALPLQLRQVRRVGDDVMCRYVVGDDARGKDRS